MNMFKCALCEEGTSLERHHLFPKTEDYKFRIPPAKILVCHECHVKIHKTYKNGDLRSRLNSLENLRSALSGAKAITNDFYYAWIAQRPERLPVKQGVESSNLSPRACLSGPVGYGCSVVKILQKPIDTGSNPVSGAFK